MAKELAEVLQAALGKLPQVEGQDPDTITTVEYMSASSLGRVAAVRQLDALCDAGILERGKFNRATKFGEIKRVCAYKKVGK